MDYTKFYDTNEIVTRSVPKNTLQLDTINGKDWYFKFFLMFIYCNKNK